MGTAHKRKAERHAIENRELSWLAFNRRVQEEADNPDNPLLERAKFLAIVTSNLDEFVQVRYQRIYQAAQEGKKFGGVGGHASTAASTVSFCTRTTPSTCFMRASAASSICRA